jgi:hypothetical protein
LQGTQIIWGDRINWNDNATSVVWSDRTLWGDRIVWGDRFVSGPDSRTWLNDEQIMLGRHQFQCQRYPRSFGAICVRLRNCGG